MLDFFGQHSIIFFVVTAVILLAVPVLLAFSSRSRKQGPYAQVTVSLGLTTVLAYFLMQRLHNWLSPLGLRNSFYFIGGVWLLLGVGLLLASRRPQKVHRLRWDPMRRGLGWMLVVFSVLWIVCTFYQYGRM